MSTARADALGNPASTPADEWRTMEYADIDTTMWIGVNALNVPDIGTMHVDEADCQALIWDTVYKDGEVFTPRRCTLLIHKPFGITPSSTDCQHDYEAEDDKGWRCKLCGHTT